MIFTSLVEKTKLFKLNHSNYNQTWEPNYTQELILYDPL